MGVISRVTIVITHIRGLITPLITAHEPPSIKLDSESRVLEGCYQVPSLEDPWTVQPTP